MYVSLSMCCHVCVYVSLFSSFLHRIGNGGGGIWSGGLVRNGIAVMVHAVPNLLPPTIAYQWYLGETPLTDAVHALHYVDKPGV